MFFRLIENTIKIVFQKLNIFLFCMILISLCIFNSKHEKLIGATYTNTSTIDTTINNALFTFPSSGYAFQNRKELINRCLEGIKDNCQVIGLEDYLVNIKIQFLTSRKEMKKYTSYSVAGFTNSVEKKLYIVANGDTAEVKPHIRHELMHLITMTTWGRPDASSTWMNEGLAAFAENNCNGYNDKEIYYYLWKKEMLLPIDTLTQNFYSQPEMIAYHQSAYIVQFLIEKYGVEKFKQLWKIGFADFEKIYLISPKQCFTELHNELSSENTECPNINWKNFRNGCK